jgi:poly(3-hydroxybutyrate) depolymerase
MREYTVDKPSLDPNPNGYPHVIGLHGASSMNYTFIATAGLILKANAEKFIVVCPNSLHYPLAWWNAGGLYEGITDGADDIGFVSALIDTMIAKSCGYDKSLCHGLFKRRYDGVLCGVRF